LYEGILASVGESGCGKNQTLGNAYHTSCANIRNHIAYTHHESPKDLRKTEKKYKLFFQDPTPRAKAKIRCYIQQRNQ
jgi:ABC-type dipeptide/oligopeptide/nickel transport system ATPase subunit